MKPISITVFNLVIFTVIVTCYSCRMPINNRLYFYSDNSFNNGFGLRFNTDSARFYAFVSGGHKAHSSYGSYRRIGRKLVLTSDFDVQALPLDVSTTPNVYSQTTVSLFLESDMNKKMFKCSIVYPDYKKQIIKQTEPQLILTNAMQAVILISLDSIWAPQIIDGITQYAQWPPSIQHFTTKPFKIRTGFNHTIKVNCKEEFTRYFTMHSDTVQIHGNKLIYLKNDIQLRKAKYHRRKIPIDWVYH